MQSAMDNEDEMLRIQRKCGEGAVERHASGGVEPMFQSTSDGDLE
jgi:hypothetical protein